MAESSRKKFHAIDVGETALVSIPKIDRGPISAKNVVGKIVNQKNNLYQIGTSSGILKTWLPRNEIQKTPIQMSDPIPTKEFTVREAASETSVYGGQGFDKCSCKASKNRCGTDKCSCFKKKIMCNSRCHSKLHCTNK